MWHVEEIERDNREESSSREEERGEKREGRGKRGEKRGPSVTSMSHSATKSAKDENFETFWGTCYEVRERIPPNRNTLGSRERALCELPASSDVTKGIKMGGKQNFRVKIPILVSPLALAFRRNGKNLDNKRIRIDNKNFMNKEVLD